MKIRIVTASYDVMSVVRLPKLATMMIRGVVGEKLKLLTCKYRTNILSRNCKTCIHLKACPYGYLYELGPDPLRINAALSSPPHPYVIENLEKEDYLPGEELKIRIKIASKAKWFDPFLERSLASLEEIGRDKKRGFGKIKLNSLKWEERDIKPLRCLGPRIRVEFKTPTAIYRENSLVINPTLYDLLAFTARRFFLIYSTYYDMNYKYRFHKLTDIKNKEDTYITNLTSGFIERWSERRKRREVLNGILGSITYSLNKIEDKELKDDIRFLIGFANEMNIGKRASAGFGKVNITSYYPR